MTPRGLRLVFQVHPRMFGGQEQFLLRQLAELRARGHRCLVVSSPSGRVLNQFERADFKTLRLPGRDFGSDCRRLAAVLRERRMDVAQTNIYSPLLALAAEMAAVPHVWRVGGHPDVALRDEPLANRNSLLRLVGSLSGAVICNSRFVEARFRTFGFRRLRMIHNGVPTLDSAPGPLAARRGGQVHVALLAHYYPQKRHQDLIRAAAWLARREPGVRFRIHGSTFGQSQMSRYREEMHALARRLDVGGALSFRPAADPEVVLAWSDIVVLPTVGESCSNAVLEALSAGRPVVAARSGGNPELIDESVGALYEPGNWRELSRVLLNLVRDSELRGRLGRKARQRAAVTHSMKRCVDAYEAVYRSLLV